MWKIKFYVSHSWTLLGTNISKLAKFSVRSALDLRVQNEARKKSLNSICNSSSFPLLHDLSLLYKSITSFTTEEINSNHRGSARSNLMQPKQLENVDLETTSASSQNCVKPSIDDFPNDYMTQYQRQKQGGVVTNFLLAIYIFGALAWNRSRTSFTWALMLLVRLLWRLEALPLRCLPR